MRRVRVLFRGRILAAVNCVDAVDTHGHPSDFRTAFAAFAACYTAGRDSRRGSNNMKLASFVAGGKAAFGVVTGDSVIVMNGRLKCGATTLREALAANALDEIRAGAKTAKPDYKLADIKFLPVIPEPQKILCAGINYRSHAAEVGRELPKQPSMFIRFTDTLVGHDGEMTRPKLSDNFDFEGEFTAVIGRGGRDIPIERALDHVAGYTCFVDGSVRDYQKFSVTSGKNWPGTGPLGPWIVTTDAIPDPTRLTLTTRLNGQQVQHSGTDQMIYSMQQIVSFCSQFTQLHPGDVIATGTPEGVGHGRKPPLWMKAGDVLEVEISGIGTLRTRVVDER
jgi:2-keto-4-pentenoate hydratase/2-oxohepta-3-ene-1,7-dioic acid hydratase in catechol pathway